MVRSYSELMLIPDFHTRLEYLKLLDNNATSPRSISEEFYKSETWRTIRNQVMDRDGRFDLSIFGIYIDGPVYVHHINPIEKEDIIYMTPKLLSLDNLICTSLDTHNKIHYKPEDDTYVERRPGDTKLW